MYLGALSDIVAALHELRNEAESKGQRPITNLCDALIETYERLEDQPLGEAGYGAFCQAHEQLLAMFDAIAAETRLPDPTPEIAALNAISVVDTREEELDLSEPEDYAPPLAKVIEFPAFVRQQEIEKPAAPVKSNVPDAKIVERNRVVTEAPTEVRAAPPPSAPPASTPPEAPRRVAQTASADRPSVKLPADADPVILEIFFEEADELLEAIDQSIHLWVAVPENRLHLENLLRSLHTLKGGARLAGLSVLGDEAHAFESFLIAVQTKPTLPTGFFDALQLRHDNMAAVIGALKGAVPGEDGLIDVEQVAEAIAKSADEPVALRPAMLPPKTPADAAAAQPRTAALIDEEAAEADHDAEVTARTGTGEPREQVRVSAALLEQLVNLAGESSIIRSRVEQGMNDFSTSLEEMETTIERVREQLRRLEIETETQVLFRQETTQGKDYEEFDPLEMDRYSQLQQLSRSLSESASDMLVLKETLTFKAREGETLLLQQARVN